MIPIATSEAEELPLDAESSHPLASPEPSRTPDERGLTALMRIIRVLERHPWALAVSVPILVALKVLRVADGDIGTAQVIFGAQGVAGLTSSVLLSAATPALLGALLVVLVLGDQITAAKAWGIMWVLTGGLLVSTFFLVPHSVFLWVTGIGLLVGLRRSMLGLSLWFMPLRWVRWMLRWVSKGRRLWRRLLRRPPRSWPPRWWSGSWLQRTYRKVWPEQPPEGHVRNYGWPGFVWLTIVGAVSTAMASAIALGGMWAPAERVTLDAEMTPIVGYVLSDDGNRAVILLEENRTTVSYRSEEIEERQRCQLTERQVKQQVPLLPYAPSPKYPSCPE